MTRVFKQARGAQSFAKKMRAKGYFAGISEEPTDSQASTRRGRAKRRYIVTYDTGSGIMRNRKNPTKAQRATKARKASVARRVASALAKYLKQQNPGTKLAGAKVEKLKGGVLKITPIKANRARGKR
jgi:hypothetical protein